jgi:hypothetical protein
LIRPDVLRLLPANHGDDNDQFGRELLVTAREYSERRAVRFDGYVLTYSQLSDAAAAVVGDLKIHSGRRRRARWPANSRLSPFGHGRNQHVPRELSVVGTVAPKPLQGKDCRGICSKETHELDRT